MGLKRRKSFFDQAKINMADGLNKANASFNIYDFTYYIFEFNNSQSTS